MSRHCENCASRRTLCGVECDFPTKRRSCQVSGETPERIISDGVGANNVRIGFRLIGDVVVATSWSNNSSGLLHKVNVSLDLLVAPRCLLGFYTSQMNIKILSIFMVVNSKPGYWAMQMLGTVSERGNRWNSSSLTNGMKGDISLRPLYRHVYNVLRAPSFSVSVPL